MNSESFSKVPRTVAVVGGRGFIGSRITTCFSQEGWKTEVFTRADPLITDDGKLSKRILTGCDVIVWAATRNTPATAMRDPRNVVAEFDEVSETLARVRDHFDDVQVMFLSSGGTVYADREVPHSEGEVLEPSTPYACLKVELEEFVRSAFTRSAILRVANAYGPGQTGTRGQGVLAHWLRAVAHGRPIHVYGNPDAARDYIYVDDIARAVYAVASRDADKLPKAVFNVGSGSATSLNQLLEIVLDVTGVDVSVTFDNSRGFDLHSSCLDISAIHRTTGWMPHTTLPEGIGNMWNWITGQESELSDIEPSTA